MKRPITGLFISLAFVFAAYGQEHPTEHPTEHPSEHSAAAQQVDKNTLAVAIERFVKEDAALKGGAFLVVDDKTGQVLQLSLHIVHRERLSRVGRYTYFACADFKTPAGKTYDLDIFMKGENAEHLTVTEISVHKEDGKERYTWTEKSGIWSKKKVK